MATEAQINANRENATHSTGPTSTAGKEASSKNRRSHGLYSGHDYVKPEEAKTYEEFCAELLVELRPEGPLQQILVSEITGASWRLRRCDLAEAGLGDFTLETEKLRRSIERARAAAHSVLHKSLNQLRKLQTQREIGFELSGEEQTQGLVDLKQVAEAKRRHDNSEKAADNAERKQQSDEIWQHMLAYINSGIPPESL